MNQKARILAVDDQNESRFLATRILDRPEYEVITVESGLETLQFLDRDPNIDVMLLDVMMPDLNGFEVLEAVRTNPDTSQIKVIMFSVLGQPEDKVKAFEAGAADYIVKPFSRIELLARVELQLKLARMEKELTAERNLLRLLIDNLPDLIYVKDTRSRFVAANVAIAKMMGAASPAELINRTDFDFYPQQLAGLYYADEQTLFRTGQPLLAQEEPVIDPAGRSGWILTTKVPLTDASGKIIGLVGIGRDITERKQMEESLRQSEAKYRELVENANSIIIRMDTQGRVTFFNEFAQGFFGYSEADIIGQNVIGTIVPEQDSAGQNLKSMIQSIVRYPEQYANNENENIRRNGQRVWVAWTNKAILDHEGNLAEILCIGNDITERVQTQAALQQSQELLSNIVESVSDGILVLDQNFRYTYWNRGMEKLTRIPREDVLHKEQAAWEIFPHLIEVGKDQAMRQAMQGEPVHLEETAYYLANGASGFTSNTYLPLKNATGEIHGVVGVIRDITERKQAEESLRKLSRAVEQSASAIVITDRQGTIEFVNPRFSAITGYTSQEAIGQNPRILKSGKHPPEFYKDMWATISRGGTWQGELLNKKKNGDLYWESATISPVTGENGELTHFVAVKDDITRRKHMEVELRLAKEAAEAAARAKSAFLANMSHEIRTPMNGIIGMTSLLLDTELTAQQRDFVEIIRTSGDALLTLINDILDFSKIEAGKLTLECQPFQLRSCLEEALDLVAPQAAEKELNLAYTLDDKLPETFEGDVTRLRQILVNLLSNAVKFTETGEVTVAITGEPQVKSGKQQATAALERYNLHFTVRDTGIGIPKDRLPRLFQSFSQVDASTTRRYGGTGLGLAISKHLSELMGGTIWVESKAGEGSTFHFTISAKAASSQQFQYLRVTQPDLLNKRVLIVDDHETNRRVLAHQTESWGMQPTTAASGPQALALMDQNAPFDLVILDMQMPDMDGLTLAANIRQHESGQTAPLILLSSLGRPEQNVRPVDFAATLTKPIKASHLYDVLVGILANQSGSLERTVTPAKLDRHMGQHHPLHILLAEDNLVNQKVALSMLTRLGYRADLAANGLEVLDALRRQPYDVVLMDIQMPEMDGLTATGHIRQEWEQAQQPHIIAMTANAMQGDREKFLAAGLDDYISKPVQVNELIAALRKCTPRFSRPAETIPRPKSEPPASSAPPQPLNKPANSKPGVSPSPKAAMIDQAVLQNFQAQLGQDGSMIVADLIGLFLADAPKQLAQLAQGLAQQDVGVVQRAAHTLKSNSATFGALEIAALCAELESRAKSGAISDIEELVTRVRQGFEQAELDLKHYLATNSQSSATA